MAEIWRTRLVWHRKPVQTGAMARFSDDARAATAQMRSIFPATPLQRNDYLSNRFAADIWLKREDLSPVRSYKIRGAFNAMRKALVSDPGQDFFVCASAGNHAQGVAYVCRHFGRKGVIFMPVSTPQQKIDKTRAFGGAQTEIRLIGEYFDDTLRPAQDYCEQVGAHFLAPFDDVDVIEGQASVAVEVLADMPALPDMIVLPVGGGGLAAGVVRYLEVEAPATELRFVEPQGGASLTAALAAGKPVRLPRIDSFVEGAAVARVGDLTFAALRDVPTAHVFCAPEDRICVTMLEILDAEGIVLEPAGALSVDVLPDLAAQIRGRTVVCVVSGGNFDLGRLPEIKERVRHFARY